MAGRVHDMINAENFARWAEERPVIDPNHTRATCSCALSQFLRAHGFPYAASNDSSWCEVGETSSGIYRHEGPHINELWQTAIVRAYDSGERSGPALAAIARDAQNREPVREAV